MDALGAEVLILVFAHLAPGDFAAAASACRSWAAAMSDEQRWAAAHVRLWHCPPSVSCGTMNETVSGPQCDSKSGAVGGPLCVRKGKRTSARDAFVARFRRRRVWAEHPERWQLAATRFARNDAIVDAVVAPDRRRMAVTSLSCLTLAPLGAAREDGRHEGGEALRGRVQLHYSAVHHLPGMGREGAAATTAACFVPCGGLVLGFADGAVVRYARLPRTELGRGFDVLRDVPAGDAAVGVLPVHSLAAAGGFVAARLQRSDFPTARFSVWRPSMPHAPCHTHGAEGPAAWTLCADGSVAWTTTAGDLHWPGRLPSPVRLSTLTRGVSSDAHILVHDASRDELLVGHAFGVISVRAHAVLESPNGGILTSNDAIPSANDGPVTQSDGPVTPSDGHLIRNDAISTQSDGSSTANDSAESLNIGHASSPNAAASPLNAAASSTNASSLNDGEGRSAAKTHCVSARLATEGAPSAVLAAVGHTRYRALAIEGAAGRVSALGEPLCVSTGASILCAAMDATALVLVHPDCVQVRDALSLDVLRSHAIPARCRRREHTGAAPDAHVLAMDSARALLAVRWGASAVHYWNAGAPLAHLCAGGVPATHAGAQRRRSVRRSPVRARDLAEDAADAALSGDDAEDIAERRRIAAEYVVRGMSEDEMLEYARLLSMDAAPPGDPLSDHPVAEGERIGTTVSEDEDAALARALALSLEDM